MSDRKETPGSGAMDNTNYEVGYYKPPKHSRFKKGQSGNPTGKRKKENIIDDMRPIIEEVAEQSVPVHDGHKTRKMSRTEAILESQRRNALNGDLRAIEALVKKAIKCGLLSQARPRSGIILTEPDGEDGRAVRMFRLEQDAMRKPARAGGRYDALRIWGQR